MSGHGQGKVGTDSQVSQTEVWDHECKEWFDRGKADYKSGARISAPMLLRFEVRRAYMLGVAVACQFERVENESQP